MGTNMDNIQLEKNAKSVRKRIFEFKTRTKFGHLASCLCCVDILVSLYRDSQTIFNPEEDIFLFSKGHGSPSIYPILADLNIIDESELDKYCEPEGTLRLHADHTIPGCHFIGGPLGNGLGYGAGFAYGSNKNVYVLVGDAELYEGSIWETLIFVSHHNINNLRIIIDRNSMGILGKTEELLKLEPLEDKFKSFGLDVVTIDGHNFDDLRKVFSKKTEKPQVIIANTIKGKGVSYMEDKWQYHTIIPKEEELLQIGIKELS